MKLVRYTVVIGVNKKLTLGINLSVLASYPCSMNFCLFRYCVRLNSVCFLSFTNSLLRINVWSLYCKLQEQVRVSITTKEIVIMMSLQSNHTLEILQNPASYHHSLIRQIKGLLRLHFEILFCNNEISDNYLHVGAKKHLKCDSNSGQTISKHNHIKSTSCVTNCCNHQHW